MFTRSDSITMTVQHESFACSRMATRNTEPEVFTFERIPAQVNAVRSYVPIRPKKRCTRVMYPAKVRMHLPPPERSQAKRWLVILCLVVLWQIYTEDPCAAETALGSVVVERPASDYQGFSFQSAEEEQQAREFTHLSGASSITTRNTCEEENSSSVIPDSTCPTRAEDADTSRSSFEQSAGNGYVVALLVYHRLGGSDN